MTEADGGASFADYLKRLPPERQAEHELLTSAIGARIGAASRFDEVIFVPGRPHPIWEDSDDAFWHGVKQLVLVSPAGDDELPVAWVGYDIASRFSNRREAQGFLITDKRLVVKDGVDAIFGKAAPRQYSLYLGSAGAEGTAAEIAQTAFDSYDWKLAESILELDDRQHIAALVAQLLAVVLERLQQSGVQMPGEAPKAADLRGRIAELGLASNVKYADDAKQAKHFTKLAKALTLPADEQILVAVTDSTLFGVYGMVLTDRGIRSKDLGEEPRFTERDRIDIENVRASEDAKHQIVVADGEVHDIATHLDKEQVDALATLIREWAVGSVR